MTAALRGTPEFKARLKAAGQMFKPYGREWTDEYVRVARPMVAVRTGKTRSSIRRRNASTRRASVVAMFTAVFLDKGTVHHTIVPKRAKALYFTDGGESRFIPKVDHPGQHAKPFREEAMRRSIRNKPMADRLIREWNSAA